MTEILRKHSDYPQILEPSAWQDENEINLSDLIELLAEYQKIKTNDYPTRLRLVRDISNKATSASANDLSSDVKKRFEELILRAKIAVEYIQSKLYETTLDTLAKQNLIERTQHFFNFLATRGARC